MLVTTTAAEERANTLTHALGLLLALAGLPYLLQLPATGTSYAGLLIFGCSMALVYATSTAYHAVQRPEWKYRLRKLDHISIYLLIAGTHTPLLLRYLPGSPYLPLIWGMAAAGLLYKLFFFGRWEWLSVAFYLVMGWAGALTLPSMLPQMPAAATLGILLGGLSYTIGVLFYAWKKLPYHHAIWHLFVIGGTLGHYLGITAIYTS
ncbi:hemolysin III family protein [Phaeodactylibacter luteus]|uniref:Hemolysin III family protein n=2 Tax=Phaeodactylibacter luteus TaxID=1564516 RepID=A0A5C6RH27_9BACT|nr:hemolysin III family protein [Phaeodactylibacter luteus]